ncbi:hypothetical protein [Agromyces badenianii]|uniref:hypothetical protein n=1 Tax=Agromyces badenianii TaxID=2080742 RepID=UPI000D592446|nr:hypothetical protein [Agromyces badenianii]PWC04033.1 hypothetical protein DCE94_07625 [Agromyces badenianii]
MNRTSNELGSRSEFDERVIELADFEPDIPAVSIHFEPAAYGITGVGTYVCTFSVEAFGRATLTASGYAAAGSVVNADPGA